MPSSKGYEILDRFSQQTSLHGINELRSARSQLKPVWFVVIGLCCIFAVVQIILVVITFQNSPTVTTVTVLTNTSMAFPLTEICLANPIDQRKVRALGVFPAAVRSIYMSLSNAQTGVAIEDKEMYMTMTFPHDNIVFTAKNWQEVTDYFTTKMADMSTLTAQRLVPLFGSSTMYLGYLHGQMMAHFTDLGLTGVTDPVAENYARMAPFIKADGSLDSVKLYFAVAFDLKYVLKSCMFGVMAVRCETVARPVYDMMKGVCYLIDVKQDQTVNGVGLTVQVNTLPHFAFDQSPPISGGIHIRVTDIFDPTSFDLYRVPMGTAALVSLHVTEMNMQVSERYGLCKNEMVTTITNFPFSDSACRIECIYRLYKKECGCIPMTPNDFLHNNNSLGVPICDIYGMLCLTTVSMTQDSIKNCIDTNCKPRCTYKMFKATSTYSDFPSSSMTERLTRKAAENPVVEPGTLNYYYFDNADLNEYKAAAAGGFNTLIEYLITIPSEKKYGATDLAYVVRPSMHTNLNSYLMATRGTLDLAPSLGAVGGPPAINVLHEADSAAGKTYSEHYKDSNILLQIAYSELVYTRVDQDVAITWDGFIAQIGGQLGLFLGCSVITICHFVVFFVQTIWDHFRPQNKSGPDASDLYEIDDADKVPEAPPVADSSPVHRTDSPDIPIDEPLPPPPPPEENTVEQPQAESEDADDDDDFEQKLDDFFGKPNNFSVP